MAKVEYADNCGREVSKPRASTITHKVGNGIAENHVGFDSLPSSLLKWARQSHKSKGRDIKIRDTSKCEALGTVGKTIKT